MSKPPTVTDDAQLSAPDWYLAAAAPRDAATTAAGPDDDCPDIEIPEFLRRQMEPRDQPPVRPAGAIAGMVRRLHDRLMSKLKPAPQPEIPAERIEFALDPGAKRRRAKAFAALDAELEIPAIVRRRAAVDKAEVPEYMRAAIARDALAPQDPESEFFIPGFGKEDAAPR